MNDFSYDLNAEINRAYYLIEGLKLHGMEVKNENKYSSLKEAKENGYANIYENGKIIGKLMNKDLLVYIKR